MSEAGRHFVDVIQKSAGRIARDRLHSHSFTINIIQVNKNELDSALQLSENIDFMIALFNPDHHEESTQFHREINRLVHNYVTSISTMADHSRNFVNLYYKNSNLQMSYNDEIQRVFNSDELCRFVRDLRNYMTHRGLPESSLEIRGTPADGVPSADGFPVNVRTGIKYGKAKFLDWDGWSAPAKRFLERQSDWIYLRDLFPAHFAIIENFNSWFLKRYNDFHKDDFAEMERMIDVYEELKRIDSAENTEAAEA